MTGLRVISCIAASILAGAAVAGCGSPRKSVPLEGPLAVTEPEVLAGRRVFMEHCNPCHPHGEAGLGPPLNNLPLPRALIGAKVRSGFPLMPEFTEEEIGDEELEALTGYLVALRRK